MRTFTYSLENYFGGSWANINQAQLKSEIDSNSGISKLCFDVGTLGDNIIIAFDNTLTAPEKTVLDGIIANHVPIPDPIPTVAYTEPGSKIVKHKVGSAILSYIGEQPNEFIIAKGSQTRYQTIKEAVAANFNMNAIYTVYPGDYQEDNPIDLPAGSVIRSRGTAENTRIIAKNPASNIVNLVGRCEIMGFELIGATSATGIYMDGSQSGGRGAYSAISECFITDCNIGIECDGKNMLSPAVSDTLFCWRTLCRTKTQLCMKGVSIVGGGSIITNGAYVTGSPPTAQTPTGLPFIYGMFCSSAKSKISLMSVTLAFNQTGLYVNDGGAVDSASVKLAYNSTAIKIGPDGTTSSLTGAGVNVALSSLYDLDVQATAADIFFISVGLEDTKIRNPHSIPINLQFNTKKFGRPGQSTIGDVSFGNTQEPTKVAIGEGLYLDSGVTVFGSNSLEDGPWIDYSYGASTLESSSFNMFNGTTVGNCLYIGSDRFIYGFKLHVLTPVQVLLPKTASAVEYWNGTEWKSFRAMRTRADYPYYTLTVSTICYAGKFHVRFGITDQTDMAKKTLNNVNKYWVRMRLLEDIPNIPTAEYLKLHTSSMVINSDGYPEYFGMARPVRTLLSNLETFYTKMTESSHQTLGLAKNLQVPLGRNVYARGVFHSKGTRCYLPSMLDTGFPIKLMVAFTGSVDVPGVVEWKLRYGTTEEGDAVSWDPDNLPDEAPNQTVVTKTIAVTGQTDHRLFLEIDVSHVDMNPVDGKTYILWLSLVRDSRPENVNDTYTGDIALILFKASFVAWNNGSHLSGY